MFILTSLDIFETRQLTIKYPAVWHDRQFISTSFQCPKTVVHNKSLLSSLDYINHIVRSCHKSVTCSFLVMSLIKDALKWVTYPEIIPWIYRYLIPCNTITYTTWYDGIVTHFHWRAVCYFQCLIMIPHHCRSSFQKLSKAVDMQQPMSTRLERSTIGTKGSSTHMRWQSIDADIATEICFGEWNGYKV
jgi:hypothetical protein